MRFGRFATQEKNVPISKQGEFGFGDIWTWISICADTKLVPSFFVGLRDSGCAYHFMKDLAGRLKNRIQLTTDGHQALTCRLSKMLSAVRSTMRMFVKIYGAPSVNDTRYSPAQCLGTVVNDVSWKP